MQNYRKKTAYLQTTTTGKTFYNFTGKTFIFTFYFFPPAARKFWQDFFTVCNVMELHMSCAYLKEKSEEGV